MMSIRKQILLYKSSKEKVLLVYYILLRLWNQYSNPLQNWSANKIKGTFIWIIALFNANILYKRFAQVSYKFFFFTNFCPLPGMFYRYYQIISKNMSLKKSSECGRKSRLLGNIKAQKYAGESPFWQILLSNNLLFPYLLKTFHDPTFLFLDAGDVSVSKPTALQAI